VEYCAKVTPEVYAMGTQIFEKEYAKEKKNIPLLFKNVFKKVQDQLRIVGASESGSTCCVVLMRKADNNRKYCSVANLGDTRAVLAMADGSYRRVSIDHKVSNPSEEERILYVFPNEANRVAVSCVNGWPGSWPLHVR
jgi:serine/threonine protein phosphatase PrpC